MYSTDDTAGSPQWVSPFGNLRVKRLFTANRSLSQCPTSFIGTWRQGIHRKLLVASPRDTENLILFGLHQKINNYSVVKVLFGQHWPFSPLTGDRCASRLSSTRVSCQLISFDNATRLIAGPRNTPKRSEHNFLTCLQDCQLQTFCHPFLHKLSGDGGI
jgi:hypothetical protein